MKFFVNVRNHQLFILTSCPYIEGYSWGKLLAYLRGGWGLINIKDHFVAPIVNEQSTSFSGWSLGGGVEYALDRYWTTNLEYCYNHYGHHIINHNGLLRLAYTSNQMLLGVSCKFSAVLIGVGGCSHPQGPLTDARQRAAWPAPSAFLWLPIGVTPRQWLWACPSTLGPAE